MSEIHLNELSKVYRESIAEGYGMGEIDQKVGAVTPIPKDEQDAARKRLLAKSKAKRAKLNKEGLDPVGKEDSDVDNDGDTDSSDKYLLKRRKAIGKAMSKKKGMKESFSDWRTDLSEVMGDSLDEKPIKEKKVNNTVKINPKLGEAVEELGGELLEAEVIEGKGDPCWDSHKQVGMKKKGNRMVPNCVPKNEEVEVEVDEAVYGGEPEKKKDTRMVVTAADKKANTPAYQRMKAGDKRYKAADHMKEGIRDTDPEKGTAERKARLEKKRGMKMDDHPQYKKEEVEVDEAMRPGPRQRKMAQKRFDQYATSRDRATAHNVAVRADGPGTDSYEKKSTGGKGKRFAGYGDQGAGNKARRRMGEKPMRGNRDPRNEEFTSEDASMSPQETALQKKKLMVDLAIAKRRKQDLAKKSETPTKAMGEEASDAMKDRRMERGGVAGNVDYSRPPRNTNNEFGKKKPSGKSALDIVKAQIRAKHGKGAIMDTKKK